MQACNILYSIENGTDPEIEMNWVGENLRPEAIYFRQTALRETSAPAIDIVRVLENTCSVETQRIVRMLGQIPIDGTEIEQLIEREKCMCWFRREAYLKQFALFGDPMGNEPHLKRLQESPLLLQTEVGCEKCSVKFILAVENTASADAPESEQFLQITSDHIKRVPFGSSQNQLTCPTMKIVEAFTGENSFPLFHLRPGQAFYADMFVSRSRGKYHSKFSPVGPIAITQGLRPIIDIEKWKTLSRDEQRSFIQANPIKPIFEWEEETGNMKAVSSIPHDRSFVEYVQAAVDLEKPEMLSVKLDDSYQRIYVSPIGHYPKHSQLFKLIFDAGEETLKKLQQVQFRQA